MRLPALPRLDPDLPTRIQAHLDDLTKPQGSLGRLEALGLRLGHIAGTATPPDPEAYLLTFAGDHGIAAHGVSAFPAEVTPQMVANIAAAARPVPCCAAPTASPIAWWMWAWPCPALFRA